MSNQLMTIDDMARVSKAMAQSNYFKVDINQAMVKIAAGQEMGIGPAASMMGIHIIQGKPELGANLIASLIKNDPRYDYRVLSLDEEGCEIAFYEDGEDIGKSSFTKADAQQAKLLGKDNWSKFPRNMYFARALSNGARWYTPGVFGGAPVYTPDELGADVDEEGEYIDVTPTVVQASDNGQDANAEIFPDNEGAPAERIAQQPHIGLSGKDGMSVAEQDIWDSNASFIPAAMALGYRAQQHVTNTLKNLGYDSIPGTGKGDERVVMYRELAHYRQLRADGLDGDAAVDAIRNV